MHDRQKTLHHFNIMNQEKFNLLRNNYDNN